MTASVWDRDICYYTPQNKVLFVAFVATRMCRPSRSHQGESAFPLVLQNSRRYFRTQRFSRHTARYRLSTLLRDEIFDATTELLSVAHAKAASIKAVAQRVVVTPPSI